jgi:cytochrome c oxidase subunit 4
VAKHTSDRADVAMMPEEHAPTSSSVYVKIFVVLFVVTAVEVFASYLTDVGLPLWFEIAVLILLSVIKGVLVVMFYMHLRFDSRWFSSLFVGAVSIAVFMVIVFLLLWSYKASLGGLVV